MRLDAATPTGTVAMDQMNNAVSIVNFFFTFVVGLAYPTPKISYLIMLFLKKKKKKKKRKKKEYLLRTPHLQ